MSKHRDMELVVGINSPGLGEEREGQRDPKDGVGAYSSGKIGAEIDG